MMRPHRPPTTCGPAMASDRPTPPNHRKETDHDSRNAAPASPTRPQACPGSPAGAAAIRAPSPRPPRASWTLTGSMLVTANPTTHGWQGSATPGGVLAIQDKKFLETGRDESN
jgi:hypothetical protein